MAAKAMVSSNRIGTSQMRNSSVLKKGCKRRSHQIFFPLSIQWVLTSKAMYSSYSAADGKFSGIPVRGNLSNTLVRYDLNPVFLPSQKGELVESANMCGNT